MASGSASLVSVAAAVSWGAAVSSAPTSAAVTSWATRSASFDEQATITNVSTPSTTSVVRLAWTDPTDESRCCAATLPTTETYRPPVHGNQWLSVS